MILTVTEWETISGERKTRTWYHPKASAVFGRKDKGTGTILRNIPSLVDYLTELEEYPLTQRISASGLGLYLRRVHGKDVEFFRFRRRSRHCLVSDDITTVGLLTQKRASELLAIKHFGKKSLREVRDFLNVRGLALKGEVVPERSELK